MSDGTENTQLINSTFGCNTNSPMALKLAALENAISYPQYKVNDMTIVEMAIIDVTTFDYATIKDLMRSNGALAYVDAAKLDLIYEIVKLLSDNKIKYNIPFHNHVCFHWRGFPIVGIFVDDGVTKYPSSRTMSVSVKVYRDELQNLTTERTISNVLIGAVGGLLLMAGLYFGYKICKY